MNGSPQQPPDPATQQRKELQKLFQFLRQEMSDSPKTVAIHNEIQQGLNGLEAFIENQIQKIEQLEGNNAPKLTEPTLVN